MCLDEHFFLLFFFLFLLSMTMAKSFLLCMLQIRHFPKVWPLFWNCVVFRFFFHFFFFFPSFGHIIRWLRWLIWRHKTCTVAPCGVAVLTHFDWVWIKLWTQIRRESERKKALSAVPFYIFGCYLRFMLQWPHSVAQVYHSPANN